jgi:murein DD-endopeptidase MepM/ murein hydrolase activator NlpD
MVELGLEPPLAVGDRKHALNERRRVSVRWLAATVLTGFSGAWLMGMSLFGAHEREATFAEGAVVVASRPAAVTERGVVSARKGDKLVRSVDIATARQTFRTPTAIRVGDREVIRVKGFSRIATPLLLAGGAHQDEIPPFNPLRLLTDAGLERGAESQAPAVDTGDAEVTLIARDLAGHPAPLVPVALSEADAQAQAREAAQAPRQRAPIVPPQMMLMRHMRSPVDVPGGAAYAPLPDSPFSRLEIRMVPENVTSIVKREAAAGGDGSEEKIATLRRGETFEALLRAQGASVAQARAVVATINGALKGRAVQEGQRVKVLFAPLEGPGQQRVLARVMLYADDAVEAIAALNDRGVFVSVAPPSDDNGAAAEDDDDEGTSLALYNSLYVTALRNDVPRAVVDDLIRILSADSDTDFQRRVTGGDAFEVFYTDDEDVEAKEILFASLTVAGEVKRFYRFANLDDGSVDYFDESGRSAKRFLLRKPVLDGEFRSGFGYRRHPILGYARMHTGVDWAGPTGTPILSAGNGTVIKAEWDSGYGRRVEIQHANGYVTTYSHLSGFARGVSPGQRIRQGQVIGYLGSSGLSTGPHLHYEVILNENYVNPMSIRVPRGRELDGRMLAEFRREKERIDALIRKTPTQTRVGALNNR